MQITAEPTPRAVSSSPAAIGEHPDVAMAVVAVSVLVEALQDLARGGAPQQREAVRAQRDQAVSVGKDLHLGVPTPGRLLYAMLAHVDRAWTELGKRQTPDGEGRGAPKAAKWQKEEGAGVPRVRPAKRQAENARGLPRRRNAAASRGGAPPQNGAKG